MLENRYMRQNERGTTRIHPQLEIGREDDEHEREANTVADKVMRMSDGTEGKIQRMCTGCEEEEEKKMSDGTEGKLQMMVDTPISIRKMSDGSGAGMKASKNVEQGIQNTKGSGQSLSPDLQNEMSSKMAADFSGVKVHTDQNAVQMNKEIGAKAFTHGNDIYFNQGQYNPSSQSGKHLLAHELAHTVQQGERVQRKIQRKVSLQNFGFDTFPDNVGVSGGMKVSFYTDLTDDHVENLHTWLDTTPAVFADIINGTGKEYAAIGGTGENGKTYRRQLLKDIITNMHQVSTTLKYITGSEFIDEVRKRAVTSLDMRVTQGISSSNTPTGYPKKADATLLPRVNEAAKTYWTVVNPTDDYYFTLTTEGRNNAYKALTELLFVHQTDKKLRSLMHCDYIVSAIHYKVMADDMGIDEFNKAVKNGEIPLTLTALAYGNITYNGSGSKKNKSLKNVSVSSEKDMIIGDHAIFYNHVAYCDLNQQEHQSWRLENAIVTDGLGDDRRFQGHGFVTPKKRSYFVDAMRDKFNALIDIAQPHVNNNDESGLKSKFGFNTSAGHHDPIVKVSGKWKIRYHKGGYWNDSYSSQPIEEMDFRKLTSSDYPNPFMDPRYGTTTVTRPSESK